MIGDMSSSGNFTALFIHQFKNIKMKLNAQVYKDLLEAKQLLETKHLLEITRD